MEPIVSGVGIIKWCHFPFLTSPVFLMECLLFHLIKHLGLPYLSPYLDSIGSNYRHGANFAIGGATIMRLNESWFENGVIPFCLELQVEQYTHFRDRTTYFYKVHVLCQASRASPIYGLYSSFVPIFMNAIFGSSRQLAIGPVALTSLLVSNVLGSIVNSSDQLYIELAILLALMVGIFECIMGLLRWQVSGIISLMLMQMMMLIWEIREHDVDADDDADSEDS